MLSGLYCKESSSCSLHFIVTLVIMLLVFILWVGFCLWAWFQNGSSGRASLNTRIVFNDIRDPKEIAILKMLESNRVGTCF